MATLPSTSDPTPPKVATDLLTLEDEGYHKGLKPRQLQMIAIGGAIGTGLFLGAGGRLASAGPPGYVDAVCEHLRTVTGRPLTTSVNLIEATQDTGAFVHVSGILKRIAVKLSKICNDLRLLSSGPRAGLSEINLPAMQAGSSIMPGKVNPVIPEVVTQVCYAVIGNDLTITLAAEAGQLQLNAFEPIIARSLFDSVGQLTAACNVLATRCVCGITPNVATMAEHVHDSIGLATALNPYLGYANASEIAREALATNRSVADIALERGYLSEEQLRHILAPERLANLSLDANPDVGDLAVNST